MMKRRMKKLSILLAAALVLTSVPVSSFGAEILTTSESENSVNDSNDGNGALDAEDNEAPAEENSGSDGAPAEENSDSNEAPAEDRGNLNGSAPAEEPALNENTGEESAPTEEAAPSEVSPEGESAPTEGENAPAQGSEGKQGTGENTEGQESSQNPENSENTGDTETVSPDTPEETASEYTGEIEWEDEVKTEDPESVKKKDGEEEDEESEETEEEPGFNYVFTPGNIDMNMDFSDETVGYVTSATQERMDGEEGGDGASLSSLASLESSYYDSYNNYVTTPKNQGATAWCWAYAAASMAETSMIKNGIMTKDELEAKPVNPGHIVESTYNSKRYDYYGETWNKKTDATDFVPGDLTYDNSSGKAVKSWKSWDYTGYEFNISTETNSKNWQEGDLRFAKGNLINTVFNFERWAGPSTEGVINFEGNVDAVDAQLENAVWVPNNDIDSIKAMIRDYGSAGIQMKISDNSAGENPDTVVKRDNPAGSPQVTDCFKYTPVYTGYSTNHTAVLVAWDDSIDRSNFAIAGNIPDGNGGFLVKSSFAGDDRYGNGYFWISYEDAAFKLYNGKYKYAVAFDFTDSKTSDFTYGYDGTNHFASFSTKKIYGIFRSSHSGETASGKVEMLKSIGVGLQDAGKYKLSIYSSFDPTAAQGSQILNEFLVETMTVQFNYPGYHTIELDEPILFYKNDVVSVCFEKYDSTNFEILVDGFDTDTDHGGWDTKKNKNYTDYGSGTDVLYEDAGDGQRIVYNSYTHGARDNSECYYITGADTSTPVSGNKVPVPGSTSDYMRIVPRLRLYTSNVKVPSNVDQTMLDIKLEKYIWTYTGNKVNPWPEVMIDFDKTEEGPVTDRGGRSYSKGIVMYSVKAKKSKDTITVESEYHYKLTYANNKEAGIAAAIVRGTGDIFSGEISMPFKIEKDQIRIEKCKILGLEPQDYKKVQSGKTLNSTYEGIKDNIIVKYYVPETKHYVNLQEGVDYKIGSIEGNNAMGKKLTVMITGIGSFKNTVKKPFKIRKENKEKPISDSTVAVNLRYTENGQTNIWEEGSIPDVDYTGKKILMEVESVYDSETGRYLEAGRDYNPKITYKASKSAGMASITLKALKGSGYSGSITRYFMINPMHITTDATVKFTKSYTYTGDPIKAKPTVKLYGKKMSQKDLCVVYINNTGSSSGEATATGIVFGRGRYTGYVGYGTFTIKPASSST